MPHPRKLATLASFVALLAGGSQGQILEVSPIARPMPGALAEGDTEKALVSKNFYTGTLGWYYQGSIAPLTMRGYASSQYGGTVKSVTACLYNEVSLARTFKATASVIQGGSTIEAIAFQRSFPGQTFTCHTLTNFNAPVAPGEYNIAVTYNPFEVDNIFAGLTATEGGQVFDVQIGNARPPTATGPQGDFPMRGVGIRYTIDENEDGGGGGGNCLADLDTHCLNFGRFKVELVYNAGSGNAAGKARTIDGVDFSGLFYFTNPNNLEMLVKVINACTLNNRFWVFFAATTNVEFTLTVTDTVTGEVKAYANPAGNSAPPIQDSDAFATCG